MRLGALLTFVFALPLAAQILPPPTAQPRPQQAGPPEETNIYLVTFLPGAAAAERAAVVQGAGAVLRRNFNAVNAVSVEVPNVAALAGLRNHPLVVGVFANRSISLNAGQIGAQAKGGNPGGGGSGGGGGGGSPGGGGGKPKPPSNLSATATSTSAISLTWTDASNNEDEFLVEQCDGAGCGDFQEVGRPAANATSFDDTGLAAGTTYRYRVAAINTAGSSRFSNIAEATTLSEPPPPPNAPTDLTAQGMSSSQIDLSWSDNSNNEDGFYIERCQDFLALCSSFDPIGQVGANATSYSSLGLAAETTYTYRVRAFNISGNSGYTNYDEATTLSGSGSGPQTVPAGVERIGAAPGVLSVTGAGVGVAIVDTGLNFNHADLGLAPEVPGQNAFSFFSASCEDIHGHGTHVGGIVAAQNNSIGVVGVAPDATLYCVNVFTIINDPVLGPTLGATDESLTAGLDWIATNANLLNPPIRVLNMSLGRPRELADDDPNHPMHLAAQALYALGISMVVSAGNDALREVSQEVPAGYPEVMAVASTTAMDGLNGYDDFFVPCAGEQNIKADTASWFTTDGAFLGGTGVTVSAPGETREDIYDAFGGCFIEPIGITSTWPGDDYIELYGTSMAAPHVTGVVALMWEKTPGLSPEDIRTRLRNNVDRIGTAPLDAPIQEYTYDGEKEGVLWAPSAVDGVPPPPPDFPPTLSITSPANGANFSTAEVISFAGTASDSEDGDLSGSMSWTSSKDGQIGAGGSFSTSLSSGSHTISVTVTDSGGNVDSDNITITVGSPGEATTATIASIAYGPPSSTMLIYVEIHDEFGAPVPGAAVSIQLYDWLSGLDLIWWFDETTDAQGVAQFQLSPAPDTCYSTLVTNVDATSSGLTWDHVQPESLFCNFY